MVLATVASAAVRRSAVCLLVWALLQAMPACRRDDATRFAEARPLMGTLVRIDVAGADRKLARHAVDSAFTHMERLSDSMNHYNPESLVGQINRRAGREYTQVTPELLKVLLLAEALSLKSSGAFDISIGAIQGWRFDPERPSLPEAGDMARMLALVDFRDIVIDRAGQRVMLRREGMRIDLGGIAKLAILDAGREQLRAQGIQSAMLNGGGDIVAFSSVNDAPWTVGVRDPRQPDRLFAQLRVTDGWVVSSGDYERYFIKDGRRYHHILNPRTGYPTEGLQQVTLTGQRWEDLSGLSATLMVMGPDAGIELLRRTPGVAGLLFSSDGKLWSSRRLWQELVFDPAADRYAIFRLF